jgi:hypothetical protein
VIEKCTGRRSCREPVVPGLKMCARHRAEHRLQLKVHRQRVGRGVPTVEEVLAEPSTRVLRALRFLGWATWDGIVTALELDDDKRQYNTFSMALRRLVSRSPQFVERDKVLGTYLYRITFAGRSELRRRLAVPLPVASDEEAAEPREGAA